MDPSSPPTALVAAGGVFLPAHLAEPIWRVLREAVNVRLRDGGRVRPELAQAIEVLREAAMAELVRANGPIPRTSADLDPHSAASAGFPVPTSTLADRLGVSERHARRLARAEAISPVRRNCWAREDVEALVARRSHP